MPICPHCQSRGDELHAACKEEDGYFLVADEDYFGHVEDPWLGRRLGDRFIISSILGQGAMGHVYKAYQEQVDRMVAIKIFETEKVRRGFEPTGPEERERFVQEARVLAKLSHPNCVTLYDFGYDEEKQFLYIAMEHVGGISLRRAVRRGLKFEAVVEVVRQVLKALREAHALGIVHRDLKPENIILSYRQTSDEQIVKVLDFGIAKLLRKDPGQRTKAGLLFGTPAYMSPEQCRGEPDITPASDMYSLGCMTFEMIAGHLPFEADRPHEMVRLHQDAPVPPLVARLGTDLPPKFEGFIKSCLAKDHRERYRHAGAALKAFEEIVGGEVKSSRLASGLAHLGDEKGARQVMVPDNRVTGAKLDPTGEFKKVDVVPEPRGSKKAEVSWDGVDDRVTDTLRNIGQDSPTQGGGDGLVARLSGRNGLILSALLAVILFCTLLFTYIYVTITS